MKAQRFWVVFMAATAFAQPAIQVTVQKQESAQKQSPTHAVSSLSCR
ncbi:MAG: hypothetical protein M3P29_04840 [Acidobacteriota bacterium]|nr:hypothetical protein [Acidobacteriota bacterium]